MNNKAIQILRGSTQYDPSNINNELLDGQPFYSKLNKQLYIGDISKNNVTSPVGASWLRPGSGNYSIENVTSENITQAIHNNSIALGQGVETCEDGQIVLGKYNASNSDVDFIVGNGQSDVETGEVHRSNAVTISNSETKILTNKTVIQCNNFNRITADANGIILNKRNTGTIQFKNNDTDNDDNDVLVELSCNDSNEQELTVTDNVTAVNIGPRIIDLQYDSDQVELQTHGQFGIKVVDLEYTDNAIAIKPHQKMIISNLTGNIVGNASTDGTKSVNIDGDTTVEGKLSASVGPSNPLIDGNLCLRMSDILNLLYPVGSLYITVSTTFDPNAVFGGRWEVVEDAYLYSSGIDPTKSGVDTSTVGNRSGNYTISVDQLPSHQHTVPRHDHMFTGKQDTHTLTITKDGIHQHGIPGDVNDGTGKKYDCFVYKWEEGNLGTVKTLSGGEHQHGDSTVTITPEGTVNAKEAFNTEQTGGGSEYKPKYLVCIVWKRAE